MAKKATAVVADISATDVSKPKKVEAAITATRLSEKKAPVLLTLTDIGDHIASTFDMPKAHAKIYLAAAVALIGKNLRKGNKVRISGLGVFQVKRRAARKGRNPASGQPIKIKATKRVAFAVARDLKAKL